MERTLPADDSPGPLVILVDDDRVTADMYGLALEMAGFRVMVFTDASELFEALEHTVPDVAVLDFHLSGILTGLDVLENVRLDQRLADLPVFILSNHYSDASGEVDRAFAAGAMAWLEKVKTPPSRLVVRISEALSNESGATQQELIDFEGPVGPRDAA